MLHNSTMLSNADYESFRWLVENRSLVEKYQDALILESIKVEQFERLYGFVLVDLIPDYKTSRMMREEYQWKAKIFLQEYKRDPRRVIEEGAWTDIGVDVAIGLGSFIPGVGAGVAAAGAIYYLVGAYNSLKRADNLGAALNVLSAIFSAAFAVQGMGQAAGTAGKLGVNATKLASQGIFSKITAIFRTESAGAKVAGEVVEEAGKHVDDLASVAPVMEKTTGWLDDLIGWLTKNGKKVEESGAAEPGMISKIITMLKDMSAGILKKIKSFFTAAKGGSADDVAEAAVDLAVDAGKITPAQAKTAKTAIAANKKTIETAGKAAAKASDEVLAITAKIGKEVAVKGKVQSGLHAGKEVTKLTADGKLILKGGEVVEGTVLTSLLKQNPRIAKNVAKHLGPDDAAAFQKALGAAKEATKLSKTASAALTKTVDELINGVPAVRSSLNKVLAGNTFKVGKISGRGTQATRGVGTLSKLKPGSTIKIAGAPMASKGGGKFAVRVILPDGKTARITLGELETVLGGRKFARILGEALEAAPEAKPVVEAITKASGKGIIESLQIVAVKAPGKVLELWKAYLGGAKDPKVWQPILAAVIGAFQDVRDEQIEMDTEAVDARRREEFSQSAAARSGFAG